MSKQSIAKAAPRVLLGLLFLFAGIMKLSIPGVEGFSEVIVKVFGFTGGFGLFVAWLVVIVEIAGGSILLLGKLVPKKLYKCSIKALILIMLGAAFFVYGKAALNTSGGDFMNNINQFFLHMVVIASLFHLCHSKIVCPLGITGARN